MSTELSKIPPVTIVIEWENAIDVEDRWTARAMEALQAELARCAPRCEAKPRILYLFDERAVRESTIRGVIDSVAPRLRELADLELVPTPGLTYYKLKNHGAHLAKTDLLIILDSDAGPQPGWLDGLLAPFADDKVMAVGGFTVLGWDDVLSKTMALAWIFNLPSERAKTVKRTKIHANNFAVRTRFFRENPFPEIAGTFKKSCGFWLRDLDRRGIQWLRTAEAMTVHAPHPGYRFLTWRAWTTGLDRDVQVFHDVTSHRPGRFAYAFYFLTKKVGRAWGRIWKKGSEVELAVWQRPIAMLYAFGFYGIAFAGEIYSSVARRIEPLAASSPAAGPAEGVRVS